MMLQRTAPTLENVRIAQRTYRLRLECPEIAARIRPGQFLMLRLPNITDPLLGRPFAFYDTIDDTSGRPFALDVVYLVVGKMTSRLADVRAGEPIELWGPLGNGFADPGSIDEALFVAGGIGQTPFLAFARQLLGRRGYAGAAAQRRTERIRLLYGVRSADLAAGIEDFRTQGVDVALASDDGSLGQRGYVTQLLPATAPRGPVYGCGPEPMLHALAQWAKHVSARCWVSLETPMACGIGACFSCVTRVQTDTGWDYKRVCVDGPIFDAAQLLWEHPNH